MNRVHTLSDDQVEALERLHRVTNDADVRSRCDTILDMSSASSLRGQESPRVI